MPRDRMGKVRVPWSDHASCPIDGAIGQGARARAQSCAPRSLVGADTQGARGGARSGFMVVCDGVWVVDGAVVWLVELLWLGDGCERGGEVGVRSLRQ
jgi:hypothetical protein